MSTGTLRLNILNKMLIGTQDLRDRVADYLRGQIQESIKVRWSLDGVFDTKLTLSSPAIDTVEVNGSSYSTDGNGHIFEVANMVPGRTAKFQNANGVVYYVGLCYAFTPDGITINPRTGKPMYRSWKDQIGVSGTPGTVTDLGNGTIRFIVDSVTESGVSNAGRSVLVYKNTPSEGATTEAIAYETVLVTWNGTNNVITTTGTLGQSPVSTTPSDYTVVCLGLSVRRNTNLETDPSHCFIGTVTGVGAGGSPTSFSNANQRLLKTIQDASSTAFSPYKWLNATTVQAALQLVPDILESISSTPGTSRIGANMLAFAAKAVFTAEPCAGLGNLSDGTYSASSTLQDVLVGIDKAVRRRLAFASISDGTHEADFMAGNIPDTDGMYALRHLANATTGPFRLPVAGLTRAGHYVGERSSVGSSPESRERVTTDVASSGLIPIRGYWSRVFLDTNANNTALLLSSDGGSNLILEDFALRAGYAALGDMATSSPYPFHLRNGYVRPQAGSDNALYGSSLSFIHNGSGQSFLHGIIENVIIETPSSSQSSPVAAFSSSISGTVPNAKRPFTFRNCVFVQTTNVPLVDVSGTGRYIFENCLFQGASGLTAILFRASAGAHIELRNCYFYAPEGEALQLSQVHGAMEGCIVDTSGTTTSANVDPQIMLVIGTSTNPFMMTNNLVIIGNGATRPTGSADKALVELGVSGSYLPVACTNLHIRYTSDASNLHRAPTLKMIGRSDGDGSLFSNIRVDFNDKTRTTNSSSTVAHNALVAVLYTAVTNLTMGNLGTPGAVLNTIPLFLFRARVTQVQFDCGTGGTSSFRWLACVNLQAGSRIDGLRLFGGTVSATNGIVVMSTEIPGFTVGGCHLSGVVSDSIIQGASTPAFIQVGADHCSVYDVIIRGAQQDVCPVLLANSNRSIYSKFVIVMDGTTNAQPPVRIASGLRSNLMQGFHVDWNGTSQPAIQNDGSDGLIDSCTFRRLTGATAQIVSTGSGNVTGSNVLSTV